MHLVILKRDLNKETMSEELIYDENVSFDIVYRQFKNQIYTYILHQVADRDVAADLYQNVMLRIYKNIRQYRQESSIKTWVLTITRNILLDYQRKQNRLKKIFLIKNNRTEKKNNAQTLDNIDETVGPDKKMEQDELHSILLQALTKLPKEQQEVIDLHYNFDLTFREISELLNCSINTVTARARYGLLKIKKYLKGTP